MTNIRLDFRDTMTIDDIKEELNKRTHSLAKVLFPNTEVQDNGYQIRIGNKGSLVINLEGWWYSFENDAGGDLLKLIQLEKDYEFTDALRWASDFIGDFYPEDELERSVRHKKREKNKKTDLEYCRRLWRKAEKLNEVNGRYFIRRGLSVHRPEWFKNIRFLPWHLHRPSGEYFPCMIAKVHDHEGKLCGLSRTFLRNDYTAKAEVSPNRMLLGNVEGGAVQLTPSSHTIIVTEGIEDALALMDFSKKKNAAVYAALGANLANFKPPRGTRAVIVAADDDEAGKRFAQKLGARLEAQGITLSFLSPVGAKDFAQLAAMGGGHVKETL